MGKIKYSPSAIKKCDKEIKRILQSIIENKKGGTTKNGIIGPSRKLREISGDLKRNIKPIIKVVGNELLIDVEVMEYYQYLDLGTDRIKKPWFLTNELTSNKEFLMSIEKLVASGLALTMNKTFNQNLKA